MEGKRERWDSTQHIPVPFSLTHQLANDTDVGRMYAYQEAKLKSLVLCNVSIILVTMKYMGEL